MLNKFKNIYNLIIFLLIFKIKFSQSDFGDINSNYIIHQICPYTVSLYKKTTPDDNTVELAQDHYLPLDQYPDKNKICLMDNSIYKLRSKFNNKGEVSIIYSLFATN